MIALNDMIQGSLFELPTVPDKGELTVLSWGAGQESHGLLYRLALDPEFRRRHAPGRLVVIGSDPGDEHPDTYIFNEEARAFCAEQGIEFHWLTAEMGYHSESWSTLIAQYQRNSTIGSAAFTRTCTSNLKIVPLYRFLAEWLAKEFQLAHTPVRRGNTFLAKDTWEEFYQRHGRIRIIFGFSVGEESRAEATRRNYDPENENDAPLYRRIALQPIFPLIDDLKWDRAATQAYIRSIGKVVPPPSNCMRCHFRSPIEILWLAKRYPEKFAEWEELEERKIAKCAAQGKAPEKNLGVYGRKRLRSVLEAAQEKYGSKTDEELEEYRYSHGHCVKSAY